MVENTYAICQNILIFNNLLSLTQHSIAKPYCHFIKIGSATEFRVAAANKNGLGRYQEVKPCRVVNGMSLLVNQS